MTEVQWRKDKPSNHGYYLGAWRRGDPPVWTVSELWYNPDSLGSGWWPTRGYLEQRDHSPRLIESTIPVEYWAPMPEPPEVEST